MVRATRFYDTSPSPPNEQEARLRPLVPLLRAGIPFVVIAQDALAIVHRVPVPLNEEMQLLVPDNLVSIAARVLCTTGLYRITEPRPNTIWCDLVTPKVGRPYPGPNAWGQTFTAWLAHTSPEEIAGRDCQNPMDILVHPQSSFHFDVRDMSRTCLNPAPPSSDLAAIRYPTWPAFFDMAVDTRFDPPVGQYEVSAELASYEDNLLTYALSDDIGGALFENEPYNGDRHTYDFRRLLPECWKALDEVKDENKLYLARSLLGPGGGASYEAAYLERSFVKLGTACVFTCICFLVFLSALRRLGRGLPPPAKLYPARVTPRKAAVHLR